MSENEKYLLVKAKNGDIEAFETLIESHQKKVFNIALRMVGNYEDAAELAQDVFVRIFKSIKGFKEESSFSTWVYKITTNVCLDELRKRKNKNTVSLDENIKVEDGEIKREIRDYKESPEEALEKKELKKAVHHAINALPDMQKTMIVMRDIHGFSYEEIAQMVKCPDGTVKSRINRARRELKEILLRKKELFGEDCVK